MSELVERLRDLHKQATVERSHYYVGKCALEAADRIEALEAALRWIADIADKQYEQDHKLRSEGARTLKRVSDRARAALEQDK